MSKKKILVLAMTLSMVAILAIGGTIAYFTDTDAKTNTFTTGKVDITLVENFTQNSKLMPGSQTENAVKKEVSIKLEKDSEDSYVWYEWLIPAALDSTDGSTGTNNIIHVNAHGYTWDTYRGNEKYWPEGQTEALPLEKTWDHTSIGGPEGYIGQETIDDILYNKYVVLYHGKLAAGEETTPAMSQVYMDSKVDTNTTGQYTINDKVINYDFSEGIDIIVRAYGIQAAGLNDVYDAYNAYNAQK